MNESGNIFPQEFPFPKKGPESSSIASIYLNALNELQRLYDEQQAKSNEYLREIDKLKSLINILKKQNDELIQEVKNLNTTLELEKANHRQSSSPSSLLSLQDNDIQSHNYPKSRSRKPKVIDKGAIDKIKSNTRHYAAACDMALTYWQKLIDVGLITEDLRPTPKCGITVRARIACCFQTVVDPQIKWTFFENRWGNKQLQSNLHRETYADREKYILVNRVFNRADDAPFLAKSKIATDY